MSFFLGGYSLTIKIWLIFLKFFFLNKLGNTAGHHCFSIKVQVWNFYYAPYILFFHCKITLGELGKMTQACNPRLIQEDHESDIFQVYIVSPYFRKLRASEAAQWYSAFPVCARPWCDS